MVTDEYLLAVLDKVEEHGWALVHVGEGCQCAGRDTDDGPPLTYTVGLTAMDHPELLVHGLPWSEAGPLLNDLGEAVAAGEMLFDGEVETCEHGDSSIMFRDVRDPVDLVFLGQVYPEFQALQVIWQDWGQRFPWEPGYNRWRFPQLLRSASVTSHA